MDFSLIAENNRELKKKVCDSTVKSHSKLKTISDETPQKTW